MRTRTNIYHNLNGQGWDLWCDGEKVLEAESYQVCSNVAYAMDNPTSGNQECDEVAQSIKERGFGWRCGKGWEVEGGEQ